MVKKLLVLSVISAAFACPSVFASSESNAFKVCQQYNALVRQKNPKSVTLSCKMNIHNAAQWQCMSQHQIKQNWSFSESAATCFQDAPALAYFMKNKDQYAGVEPKIICEQAIKTFQSNAPGNKQLEFLYGLCDKTERTAEMWACMNNFASKKNSFNYSTGQCFPQKT